MQVDRKDETVLRLEEEVPGQSQSKPMEGRTKFVICFLGIFVSYFYYGILQEKITRVPYGEEKEKFVYFTCLVFLQCIVNALFAKIVVKIMYKNEDLVDKTPALMYGWCAFSYICAMLASNSSLQFVNYPTQVLGKSIKPIPVMILGVLFSRKKYPLAKYVCVLLIVCGVALFMYKDDKNKKIGQDEHVFGLGEILLLISLFMDGMTGATQDRMKMDYQTKSHHMMFNMNLWSIGIMGAAMTGTGEVWRFIEFCQKYPHVLTNILMFSLCSAIGQNFIFVTVTNFGPLACSIITTTRKFFTILASVLFFGNSLIGRQWIGVVLVFAGLSMDSYISKRRKH